jgi:hypothetical protein
MWRIPPPGCLVLFVCLFLCLVRCLVVCFVCLFVCSFVLYVFVCSVSFVRHGRLSRLLQVSFMLPVWLQPVRSRFSVVSVPQALSPFACSARRL